MKLSELRTVLADKIVDIEVQVENETYSIDFNKAKTNVFLLGSIFGNTFADLDEFEVEGVYVEESGFGVNLVYTPRIMAAINATAKRFGLNIVHTIYNKEN